MSQQAKVYWKNQLTENLTIQSQSFWFQALCTPTSNTPFQWQNHQTVNLPHIHIQFNLKKKTKLRGLSPHANYTERAAAAGRWS